MDYGSGVKGFIKGTYTVEVFFPIQNNGKVEVCCDQCQYYGRNSKTCQLNKQIVNYPDKFLGVCCPLSFDGEMIEKENA